ncbi:MAG: hypothetical protein QNJ78_12820 [Gammaproteobacteria bacterium]|nr:hypothetical protein [Gammaproteobacteria bacterium]
MGAQSRRHRLPLALGKIDASTHRHTDVVIGIQACEAQALAQEQVDAILGG